MIGGFSMSLESEGARMGMETLSKSGVKPIAFIERTLRAGMQTLRDKGPDAMKAAGHFAKDYGKSFAKASGNQAIKHPLIAAGGAGGVYLHHKYKKAQKEEEKEQAQNGGAVGGKTDGKTEKGSGLNLPSMGTLGKLGLGAGALALLGSFGGLKSVIKVAALAAVAMFLASGKASNMVDSLGKGANNLANGMNKTADNMQPGKETAADKQAEAESNAAQGQYAEVSQGGPKLSAGQQNYARQTQANVAQVARNNNPQYQNEKSNSKQLQTNGPEVEA